jgi:hypothetical protein
MFMDVYHGLSWFIMVYPIFSGNDPALRDGSLIPSPKTVSLFGGSGKCSGDPGWT